MKKVSTAVTKPSRNISQPKLTIGLDLGDRPAFSWKAVTLKTTPALARTRALNLRCSGPLAL